MNCFFFFFNDTATTEIYTLSLHDALPIFDHEVRHGEPRGPAAQRLDDLEALLDRGAKVLRPRHLIAHVDVVGPDAGGEDRKSTRLNSSHLVISYAVFCLKKKIRPTCLIVC